MFWARVERRGPDECWPWIAGKGGTYGRLYFGGKNLSATHVALELAGRPVPYGAFVCHHCDNPACVNPAHLFAGSQSENIRDAVQKGRHIAPVSERNGQARLTAEIAAEIRRLRVMGVPGKVVAQRYAVSQGTVSMIHRGKRWQGGVA